MNRSDLEGGVTISNPRIDSLCKSGSAVEVYELLNATRVDNVRAKQEQLYYGYTNMLYLSGCGLSIPKQKYEIVKKLQERKHIYGIIGDGVNDAPAKKADIGIAVDGATDTARSAYDIMLKEPGHGVVISAVLTSRAISRG